MTDTLAPDATFGRDDADPEVEADDVADRDTGDDGGGAGAAAVPRNRLGYQPALDGLRGLALLAIFAFHAGFDWAPGAFLSVSTFFTLSGFLITVLLLDEFAAHGRIARRAFWARRFRRLLPASLLAILGIVVACALFADASQLARLRGDVIACLAYVANWRFIFTGDSYAAIFASKSPMQHFWSLAIEEQFYLLYPLLLAGVLAVARGSRRVVAAVFGVMIALSVTVGIVLLAHGSSLDRLYYGTDIRGAELLVGALLALWWVDHRSIGDHVGRRALLVGGAVGLVVMLVLWRFAQRDNLVWYRGGLPLYAVLTALVVLAAVQASGPARRVLAFRPLVLLGLISYGAYLIHWPVFVFINEGTGLAPLPLFALRIAVTLSLATMSYLLIEQPIRSRRLRPKWSLVLVPASVVAILAGAVLVGGRKSDSAIDFQAARDQLSDQTRQAAAPGVSPELAAALNAMDEAKKHPPKPGEAMDWNSLSGFNNDAASTAPTFAVFGDSTALLLGLGLHGWANDHLQDLKYVGGWAELGCGTLEDDRRFGGELAPYNDKCRGWLTRWDATADANHPQTAIIMLGPWEVADTQLPGETNFRSLGDPVLDAAVHDKLAAAVDSLLDRHEKVLLLNSPEIQSGRVDGKAPPEALPESDPSRMARWNQIVADVAAARSHVAVIDFAGWVRSRGTDDDRLRPDGIHFTTETAREAADWLGPEISRVSKELDSR